MDPLGPARKGQVSPFLKSFSTTDTALEILRNLRQTHRGKLAANKSVEPVGPTCRVWVRNDTGSTLTPLSIVKLGDPVISPADHPFEVQRGPVFKGMTPDDAGNAFAIIEDGLPATPGELVKAVVLGVTVCNVSVSDADHEYAEPAASVVASLASASVGPARVLWRAGGLGQQKALVLLTGVSVPQWEELDVDVGDNTLDTYAITADNTWEDTGHEIPVSAGEYLVRAEATGEVNVTGVITSGGFVMMRLADAAGTGHIGTECIITVAQVTNMTNFGTATVLRKLTFTEDTVVKLQARRSGIVGGGTWVTAQLRGAVLTFGHVSLGHLKLS